MEDITGNNADSISMSLSAVGTLHLIPFFLSPSFSFSTKLITQDFLCLRPIATIYMGIHEIQLKHNARQPFIPHHHVNVEWSSRMKLLSAEVSANESIWSCLISTRVNECNSPCFEKSGQAFCPCEILGNAFGELKIFCYFFTNCNCNTSHLSASETPQQESLIAFSSSCVALRPLPMWHTMRGKVHMHEEEIH